MLDVHTTRLGASPYLSCLSRGLQSSVVAFRYVTSFCGSVFLLFFGPLLLQSTMIPAPLAGARSLDGLLAVSGWSEGLLRCFLFSRYLIFCRFRELFH